MDTLRQLHETFRREDAEGRDERRNQMLRRAVGDPDARRECEKAIRCDARETGKCRWCGRRCEDPVDKPSPPYSTNQGDVLKDEAYRLHWGNDDVDLPYWYQGTGRVWAGWDS